MDARGARTGPRLSRPAIAGGSQEADALERGHIEVRFVAWACAAATIVLGIVPGPLFHLAGEISQVILPG